MTDLKTKNPVFPKIIAALLFIAAAELVCRGLDFYDGWKRYNVLLTQTVNYRGQTYSLLPAKDTKRILILGGSAVHDTVKDYHESWPYLLEQNLREKTHSKVEVINLGYYSECSIDEVFKMSTFGADLHPDLVIVFDGENDVYNLWHQFDYWKKLYELKAENILHEKKHDPFTRFFGNLRKNSALYQRMNRLKRAVRDQMTEKALEIREKGSTPGDAAGPEEQKPKAAAENPLAAHPGPAEDQFFEDESRWPEIEQAYRVIYESNLDKIARLTKRAGAKGLFIFQPDLSYKAVLTDKLSDQEKAEYLKIIGKHESVWKEIQKRNFPAGIAIMKQTAEKYGFAFHDLNPEILMKGDAHALFEGNVHFSPAGRAKIVQAMTEIILTQDLLKN